MSASEMVEIIRQKMIGDIALHRELHLEDEYEDILARLNALPDDNLVTFWFFLPHNNYKAETLQVMKDCLRLLHCNSSKMV